jgi:SAM-dependent methyltransferase
MPPTEPKPSHLSGDYGAWFKDSFLAEAYPARPAYPVGVIRLLTDLAQDTPRVVLDVGCGTGELARRLAHLVERVDAVDFSDAMLRVAKRLDNGDAPNVNWIAGAVEEVTLRGPYVLITAGESLHWMDWDVVMARFSGILTGNGVLAIISRSWDTDPSVWERVRPLIERYSPVRDFRPYNLVSELVRRGLLEVRGERQFGPEPWRPTIDEYLECRHSQRGLSRTHMGPAAVAAFDAEVRHALEDLSRNGVLPVNENRLDLSVEARVAWGVPRARPAPRGHSITVH